MRGQPDSPKRLYTVYSRTQGLVTEPDAEDEARYVLHSDATQDENFSTPGSPAPSSPVSSVMLHTIW